MTENSAVTSADNEVASHILYDYPSYAFIRCRIVYVVTDNHPPASFLHCVSGSVHSNTELETFQSIDHQTHDSDIVMGPIVFANVPL